MVTAIAALHADGKIGRNWQTLLEKRIETTFRAPVHGPSMLIIGGIVMWVVDSVYERSKHQAFARGKLTEDMEQMSVAQAVLDRLLSDLLSGLPWYLALHVHYYGRRTCRDEPPGGAGLLSFLLSTPDHGGGDLLRPVEVATPAPW